MTGGLAVVECKFVPEFSPESPHPIQNLSARDPGLSRPKTRPSPEEGSEGPA